MTVQEASWLRDAYDLVFIYRTNETIRNQINSTFSYNRRSVFFYIEALVRFSPNYFRYYKQVFQREIGYFNSRAARAQWKDILPTRLWDFFNRCAVDSRELEKVRQTISNHEPATPLYTAEQIRKLTAAENQPPQQRKDLIDALLDNQSHTRNMVGKEEVKVERPKEEEPPSPPQQIPSQLKELAKDVSSKGQILTQKAEAGVERGGENLAARMGGGALRAGGGLARTAGGTAARGLLTLLFTTPVGWAILGVVLLFFILPILLNLLDTSALLPPFQQVGQAAPITPPGSSPSPTSGPSVPVVTSSCPIPNGRISCGSYENRVRSCHCIDTYPPRVAGTLCNPLLQNSILTRTAKAIDIMPQGRTGRPGDKVYLPSIQGQIIRWRYIKTETDRQGFGHLRLFQSEPTTQDAWSMYMIHVDHDNPVLTPGTLYRPGEEVAWIGPKQDHIHINIGLNIGDFGGQDFFDPGWKFPDKDLSMCTGTSQP